MLIRDLLHQLVAAVLFVLGDLLFLQELLEIMERIAPDIAHGDAIHSVKELLKEKEITEDEERRAEDDVQKITDRHIAEVDKLLDAKETDLMEI